MKITEFDGASGTIEQTPATRQVVMGEILTAAPILNFVEFYPYIGSRTDSITKNAKKITTGVGSRAIGDDFVDDADLSPDFADMRLKVVGGKVKMDKAYERSNAGQAGSEYLRLMKEYARGLGRYIQNLVINGNSTATATDFDGARKLCKAGNIYIFDTENGGYLPLGNATAEKKQQQKFVESMEEIIEYADVVVMDIKTRRRLKAIAWDKIERVAYEDVFGRKYNIDYWEDKPIIIAGKAEDDTTRVLPHDETVGTSTDCTSVIGLKFGEKSNFAFATNVGFQVGTPSSSDNLIKSRIEADMGTVLLNDDAIRILTGVRINNS
jgi:hypothetical protein